MKTKTLIMVCLLFGIGLTKLSAQSYVQGTGTFSWHEVYNEYFVPVYAPNGDQVDLLASPVTAHLMSYYKNWEWIWSKAEFSGDIVSVGFEDNYGQIIGGTGEVFKIKDIWKADINSGLDPGHFNAIGNQGSHYLIKYIWDENTMSFIFVSAVWPGYKE